MYQGTSKKRLGRNGERKVLGKNRRPMRAQRDARRSRRIDHVYMWLVSEKGARASTIVNQYCTSHLDRRGRRRLFLTKGYQRSQKDVICEEWCEEERRRTFHTAWPELGGTD